MKFPSGVIGILDFCRQSCYGYDIRLEVNTALEVYSFNDNMIERITKTEEKKVIIRWRNKLKHTADYIKTSWILIIPAAILKSSRTTNKSE